MTRTAALPCCSTSSSSWRPGPNIAPARTCPRARHANLAPCRGVLQLVKATNDDGPSSSRGNSVPDRESSRPDSRGSSGLPDTDEDMRSLWERIKTDAKQNLSTEEASMLETINLKDVETGDWARKLADQKLGPILEPLGVQEDPLDFFTDLIKLMMFMQLITVGTMFYSAELLGHMDTGEAFRMAGGLTLGYMLRPFFKVEQLLYPVYNWGLTLFFSNMSYEIEAPDRTDVQATLNRLGILIAAAFFVPQALLHWKVADCTQLITPMGFGLFLFDVVLMIALLLKLRML